MKYKIEIWRFHVKIDTFEDNNINKILKWYKEEYQYMYYLGECTFCVYINNIKLKFKEKNRLGFYTYDY